MKTGVRYNVAFASSSLNGWRGSVLNNKYPGDEFHTDFNTISGAHVHDNMHSVHAQWPVGGISQTLGRAAQLGPEQHDGRGDPDDVEVQGSSGTWSTTLEHMILLVEALLQYQP